MTRRQRMAGLQHPEPRGTLDEQNAFYLNLAGRRVEAAARARPGPFDVRDGDDYWLAGFEKSCALDDVMDAAHQRRRLGLA